MGGRWFWPKHRGEEGGLFTTWYKIIFFSVHIYFCSFGIRGGWQFFSRGGAPLNPITTAIYSILFLTFMDPPEECMNAGLSDNLHNMDDRETMNCIINNKSILWKNSIWNIQLCSVVTKHLAFYNTDYKKWVMNTVQANLIKTFVVQIIKFMLNCRSVIF